jgi:hypothetical protein
LGNLGCTWEGDGQRHDFASLRLEGAAYKSGTIYTGLRMPLSNRTTGKAFVLKVAASSITATGPVTDPNNTSPWATITPAADALVQLDLGNQGIRAIQWCPEVDGTGKFLIISGPPSTDPNLDHPSIGRFALWSWDGISTSAPVKRIRDLLPYCRYPTGVCSFTIYAGQKRIAFSQGAGTLEAEQSAHLIHWPISILSAP